MLLMEFPLNFYGDFPVRYVIYVSLPVYQRVIKVISSYQLPGGDILMLLVGE